MPACSQTWCPSTLELSVQDFMGFLHLGWDVAAKEELPEELEAARREEQLAAWLEVASCTDLARPGLATVRRIMSWGPLHVAAMEGTPAVVRRLVQELGLDPLQRSANSWTALHCAAAHNKVSRALHLDAALCRCCAVLTPFGGSSGLLRGLKVHALCYQWQVCAMMTPCSWFG